MRAPLLLALPLPLLGLLSACSEPYDPQPLASTGNATALIGSATVARPLCGDMQTSSRDGSRKPGGMCPIHTFDQQGRLGCCAPT